MNKNMLHKGQYLIGAIIATMMTVSCEYKDLGDADDTIQRIPVQLAFDYSNVDSFPEKMQVMFYRGETGSYSRYDIGRAPLSNPETIYITPGEYQVVAWNNDAKHVYFQGYDARKNISAKTPKYNPHNSPGLQKIVDSLFNGQEVLDYPDYMVHSFKDTVIIDLQSPKNIILNADSMVVTVDVRIGGIAGLEIVRMVKGAINNVAGRRYMAWPNKATDPVTVLFEARSNAIDSTVTAHFWVFGLEPEELQNTDHKAALFFWTNRGKVFVDLDVTDFFRLCGRENSHLTIDIPDLGIDIRDYLPKAGLDVDIDEWDDEYKPIGF